MQNTHLVFPAFTAQGHGSGTMGTAVGGVVRGCGRPAAAGGRVSRAQSAAVCFLGDLWVPWALPFSFVFRSAGALTGEGTTGGRCRGRCAGKPLPSNDQKTESPGRSPPQHQVSGEPLTGGPDGRGFQQKIRGLS